MPTFSSRPLSRRPLAGLGSITPKVRRHPVLLFGVPFIVTIVAGSFGLSYLTQTRYDYNASKIQTMSKQEELGMRKDRRKVDIREEYFVSAVLKLLVDMRMKALMVSSPSCDGDEQRLQAKDSELEQWEPVRIARPAGVPEWGVPPSEEPSPSVSSSSSSSSSRAYVAEELQPGKKDPFSNPDGSMISRSPKVILGPDGKPCRACNSKLAFSAAMRNSNGSAKDENASRGMAVSSPPSSKAGASTAIGLGTAAVATQGQDRQCPPDGETIGNGTWTFLHSVAAYYPSQPSTQQQSSMIALVEALPHLYPCHSCAESLQEELQREQREKRAWHGGSVLKEAVKSGPGLRKWLCGIHNEVNSRLGKPTWSCEENVLQERWASGPEDGSCD